MEYAIELSRITNTSENSLSNSGGGAGGDSGVTMEPSNLIQTAAAVVDTVAAAVAAGGDGVTTSDLEQSTTQTFPVSLPRLELKLPILSSSSSDSEPEEHSNPTAGTSTVNEGERVASPPPNCAICLGRCKNKCFTDSCMHQFCFKCLCEWSKVKPECPLCKQTFKSIIHNVKSIHQFEEYHVQPPAVQIAHPTFDMDFPEMRIFGVVHQGNNRNHGWNDTSTRPFFFRGISAALAAANATGSASSGSGGAIPTSSSGSSGRSIALGGSGGGLRNQYVYRGELLDLYRQEYPDAIASSGTLSQLWRRYVYDRKLYAMPVADITGRFRESSARFYRDNPSQIHRLMPWINRDIVCLLRQTEHDVTTVLESINSALTLMNILSPAFRRRLQRYLGTKTAHFIHELNNFARSPYDMIGYDRAVQYSAQSNDVNIVIEFTSSDESTDNEHDVDVLNSGGGGDNGGQSGGGGSNNNTRSTTTNASINAINLTIHNRLTSASNANNSNRNGGGGGGAGDGASGDAQDDVSLVIDLRGETDNIENASTTTNREAASNFQDEFQQSLDLMTMPAMLPSVSENIELTSGSSDECEFVLERKPPHLRTPEMVSLDSASDSDVVFVDESKALNKTSFTSSEGEQHDVDMAAPARASVATSTATAATTTSTTSNRSKITALVEAKNRNHSANLVKNEQQDNQTEIYNVGASTSAALRLSLQKRVDKSKNSKRLRRERYAIRNNERHHYEQESKSRGKRLASESSHSSTTSSSSTSSTSTTTTTSTTSNSTTSTSDEDYVVSSNQRKRRKVRKTKKRKNSNISTATAANTTTTKRDGRKRKKPNSNNYDDSHDDEDDDDDNGHMGKNFALAMAINERIKRQNQKKHTNSQKTQKREDRKIPTQQKMEEEQQEDDHSEGENSWRLKAVTEPLRKQQQQLVQSSQKSNERKRHRKTASAASAATQQSTKADAKDEPKDKRRRKNEKPERKREGEEKEKQQSVSHNVYESSSDESDNINLIQLKTKLISGSASNNREENITSPNSPEHLEENDSHNISSSSAIENETLSASAAISYSNAIDQPPEDASTSNRQALNSPAPPTPPSPLRSSSSNKNLVKSTTNRNVLQNSSDSSDSNYEEQPQNTSEQMLRLPSPTNTPEDDNHRDHHEHHQDHEDHDDQSRNVYSSMNLPESNVFVDGTSMMSTATTTTTTTTDTILHDAAEQISSAAVNFYNPQQTFNTADFAADNADENSTNSSSSDSSISSFTTSLSSSSNNSSSSNTNGFVNYNNDDEHPQN